MLQNNQLVFLRDESTVHCRPLSEEAQLEEIVKLIGMDALSPSDRLTMETARSLREDFLHQLAFHEVDTYTSSEKQYMMMKLVAENKAKKAKKK